MLGLFLLTGACGGSIEDGSTETPVPVSEEAAGDGETSAQAFCDYSYSDGTCGSCTIPAAVPGEVSAMAYPGQSVRRRQCCQYSNGTVSCGSYTYVGCRAC